MCDYVGVVVHIIRSGPIVPDDKFPITQYFKSKKVFDHLEKMAVDELNSLDNS